MEPWSLDDLLRTSCAGVTKGTERRGGMSETWRDRSWSVWLSAAGYFACYVPYSGLTKALSSGLLPGQRVSGLQLLPWSAAASLVSAAVFLLATGWWRSAVRGRVLGVPVPAPTRWTFLSGVCSAAIIATTTLSYAFAGPSILLMMLLMRGGVLALAPITDAATGRKVQPRSWIALGLSLLAVLLATIHRMDLRMTLIAALDVAVYLAAYFLRLRFMSRIAKSKDLAVNRRYFVEEQLVSTPVLVAALALVAALGDGAVAQELRRGFGGTLAGGHALAILLVGVLSQGTGVFGALVLLDARENSFCVPVNRASSLLAGVAASAAIAVLLPDGPAVSGREALGAGLLVLALAVLAVKAGAFRALAPGPRRSGPRSPGRAAAPGSRA